MKPVTQPSTVVKSNYNLGICCGCGRHMDYGDEITRVEEARGMELRPRTTKTGGGYIPTVGARWVHKLCTPVHTYPDGTQVPCWTAYAGEQHAKTFA